MADISFKFIWYWNVKKNEQKQLCYVLQENVLKFSVK